MNLKILKKLLFFIFLVHFQKSALNERKKLNKKLKNTEIISNILLCIIFFSDIFLKNDKIY